LFQLIHQLNILQGNLFQHIFPHTWQRTPNRKLNGNLFLPVWPERNLSSSQIPIMPGACHNPVTEQCPAWIIALPDTLYYFPFSIWCKLNIVTEISTFYRLLNNVPARLLGTRIEARNCNSEPCPQKLYRDIF
jgi:hypothetical protein